MLPTIPIQILVNFGQRKSHQMELQSCVGFENLEKELASGPLASSPRRPTAACPGLVLQYQPTEHVGCLITALATRGHAAVPPPR
jgi:hypothetical protein